METDLKSNLRCNGGEAMTKTPEELTADWHAGKLAANWYYLKFEDGEIGLQSNNIGGFIMSIDNEVVQVLAPVPTYDQFVDLTEKVERFEKKLSYAMEALNFYAKDKSFGGNCARDALKKIERVGKKHDLSNNH